MTRWRPREAGEALDAALSRMMRGESLQVCLSPYPEMASELLPLLLLAQRLQALAAGRPDPAPILAAGKARFLEEARRLCARSTFCSGHSPRPGSDDSLS